MIGSLLVGSSFAKSLSLSLDIPLIEVNHMQAHLLCHFIKNDEKNTPKFPFIGVTISGGHTQLILVEDYFKMTEIGTTLDDAIGEAFDKCGKNMGLNYPAGPEIDKLAKGLSRVKRFAQDSYTAEDDFWKIFTYLGEHMRIGRSVLL